MTPAQELKALGRLTHVELKDLDKLSVQSEVLPAMDDGSCCGFPDQPDEQIASESPDTIAHYLGCDQEHGRAVQLTHLRYWEAAKTGSGSWPAGCHPDLSETRHATTYYVNRDQWPDKFKRKVTTAELDETVSANVWGDREKVYDLLEGKTMLDCALILGIPETYWRVGNQHHEVQSESEADIVVVSRYIPGGTAGIGWFPNGTCSDQVEFHIDSSLNYGLHPLTGLIAHECGHTNKLQHTFAGQNSHKGVMSYRSKYPYEGYSTGEAPYTLPRDPSWDPLTRYYGGEPFPPDTDPTQPPTELPPQIVANLRGEIHQGRPITRGTFTVDYDSGKGKWTYAVSPVGNTSQFKVEGIPRL